MTVEANERKELKQYFGKIDTQSDDILKKLVSLKQIFNLDSQDLFIKWEQHVNRIGEDLDISLSNLDGLQQYLQSSIVVPSKLTPSMKKDGQGMIRKRQIMKSSTGFSSSPVNGAPSTPSIKKRKVDGIESSPVQYETANNTFASSSPRKPTEDNTPFLNKLTNQQDSNTVIETLNAHIQETPGFTDLEGERPFKLGTNFDPQKFKFRTMSMKLLESADVLDEQIDLMAQTYMENLKSDKIEFGNPCLSSQFDIVCSGRIVPDTPLYDTSSNATLNATSLFLETSRLGGIGQRIPLDLSQLKEYGLFPGQIVILKGRNPTGRAFIVQEVLELPALGNPLTSKDELEEFHNLLETDAGLKILVASGPYSNQNTLNYQKLSDLVDKINSDIKPHVVLLYGPFVDLSNNSVTSGDIEIPNEKYQPKTLDDVFRLLITPILKKIHPKIQVILVPSLRDSCIKHISYPQDSFDRKKFGLPKNVKVFPNPSSFSVNEVLIGGSNMDIFKDLRDVYKPAPTEGKVPSNRFDRIINYIFEQRRYYPNFPGSIKKKLDPKSDIQLLNGSMAEEVSETAIGGSSLEVPYMGLAELGETLPDILITPSEMKHFAKAIKGVVVVNPGQFIRPNKDTTKESGTYAIINIKAPELDGNEEDNVKEVQDGLYYHNVSKRSRVDIYKS